MKIEKKFALYGIILSLIIIMPLINTGCSSKEVIRHNYTYKGENKLWSAEYFLKGTQIFTEKDDKIEYAGDSSSRLTIKYKKGLSELYSVKHLEISYEKGSRTGEMTIDFNGSPPDRTTYVIESQGNGTEFLTKDGIVKVYINMDGANHIIELQKVR